MMGSCKDCPSHGLSTDDFKKGEQEINEETEISHWVWKTDITTGHVTKTLETRTIWETLDLWTETIDAIKKHIHRKRVQFRAIENIKKNLVEGQILIHLDYSENYKATQQNEVQSAYFGSRTFTLFTACVYHREDGQLQKLSVTVTTEASSNKRSTSMGCLNKVNKSLTKISFPTAYKIIPEYVSNMKYSSSN